MISIEIDVFYFFASLLFLYHSLESFDQKEQRNLFVFYWMGVSLLFILILGALRKWEIFIFGWEKESIFHLLTKSNLILFFTHVVFEERIFSYKRSIGFIILLFLSFYFASFFYWIESFQITLNPEDQSQILPFTISVGSFIWLREMFWQNPKSLESKLGEGIGQNLILVFLPCFLFLLSPQTTNYGFIEFLSSVVVIGIASLVGFTFVSQILKESLPREAELGVWVGTIGFSSVIGVDLLVSLPLSFVLGMSARGLYAYLDQLGWSVSGKRGVVSFLYPSIIGILLPFFVLEPKDWNHAPYVLLGVQVLYFLSFYLVSSLVFGLLLLSKPKSD
ncbi:hypothetical protein AB3N60_05840 [Leptospira sp. WS39.C2]